MSIVKNAAGRLVALKSRFSQLSGFKKIVILLSIILLAWLIKNQIVKSQSQNPSYQTATVERGILISSVAASGSVSAGSGVTTTASGIVSAVYVADGDYVATGQKIVEINLDQDSLQRQAAAWSSY